MAIPFAQPIKRLGAYPIDESLVLTKAKMLAAVDNEMPSVYLCIGEEDGKLYLYDKRNDVDPVTGKYRVFEGGKGGNYDGLGGIVVDNDARTISIDPSVIATVEAVNAALAEKADAADVYDIATIDTLLLRLEDEIGNKADKADTYTKTEVDALIPDVSGFATQQDLTDGLALKADAADTYTKTEVDALIPDVSDFATEQELTDGLALKADAATTYTKTETDALLADKADADNVYTKEQEDAKLAEKADKATTYTKEQTDALLDAKAGKSDVPFVATYEATTYEEVKAAIDANRAIVVDFPNNNNLICVTFSAYTTGQNITMSGIYKFGDNIFVTSITLTPANAWSISNSGLYDKAEVDALIPDVSGFATEQELTDGLALKADAAELDEKATMQPIVDASYGLVNLEQGGATFTFLLATAGQVSAVITDGTNTISKQLATLNSFPNKPDLSALQTPLEFATLASDNESLSFSKHADGDTLILKAGNGTTSEEFLILKKAAIQLALLSKADKSNTYTKPEVDAAIAAVPTGVNFEVGVERWYGTYTDENGVTYQVYTKTIYIPALAAAAGATTYPHGISGIKQILSAYGFTTDGFVMNAPRQNVADNISIYQVQKAGGIVIEVGKDRSSKKAYVTLIYAKNN